MSSKDLTFDTGIEHQFPVGLSIKKIQGNDVFYLGWKDNFKKSITKCVKKLLKDIKTFQSLIHYIHNYELNKKAVKEIYDFDEIKELIYLVNICCWEYEFTKTANFTKRNHCIKKYLHRFQALPVAIIITIIIRFIGY